VNFAAAFRTSLGNGNLSPGFPSLTTLMTCGMTFPGALHDHAIADPQPQTLDFIHVVQRRTADRHAADFDGFEHRNRRERPRCVPPEK